LKNSLKQGVVIKYSISLDSGILKFLLPKIGTLKNRKISVKRYNKYLSNALVIE